MASTRIELLGDVVVHHDGRRHVVRGAQPRTVLTMLSLERGRSVARDELADALWPDELPAHWSGAVRGVITKLRAALAAADPTGTAVALDTTQDGWRLESSLDALTDVEAAELELALAERLAAEPAGSASVTRPYQLARRAAEALARPLAPGARGEWIERRRTILEERSRRAWTTAADAALGSGAHDDALVAVEQLLLGNPFDEASVRLAIRVHLARGDRGRATMAHDRYRDLLRDELGAAPDPSTTALLATQPVGPLPLAPPRRRDGPFVGRAEQLELLSSSWASVVRERQARALFVIGEPGAGKTRLVEEFVGRAAPVPAAIRWGVASAGAELSYQPILMAFPGSAEQLVGRRQHPAGSSGLERSAIFVNLTERLAEEVDGPTIVVIDDLHWADEDTLALLSHLGSVLAHRPLMWILTSRTARGHLGGLLEATTRSVDTVELTLGGLDAQDVSSLLRATGVEPDDELARTIADRTGGNPFFVEELVASVDSGGQLPSGVVPDSLRSWMSHRVGELDRRAADLLGAAAVLGNDVDVSLLSSMLSLDQLELLARCDELVERRWFDESDRATLRFRHAIVRDALVDAMGPARRAVLHERAARALATVPTTDPATLADHLARAGPMLAAEATAAMLAAGDEALARSAWAAADGWFSRALGSVDPGTPSGVRALLGVGRARRGIGDRPAGRDAFEQARSSASAVGDHRAVAEATLGLVGGGARGVSDTASDDERGRLLRSALEPLAEGADDDLIIRVQLELALTLVLTEHVEERDALVRDSLERARRVARPDLLAEALLGSRLSMGGPEHDPARTRLTDEALALARSVHRVDLELAALVARHEDALLAGDRDLARDLLEHADALAVLHDHPYWRWVTRTWSVLGHVIDGELDEAEAGAMTAVELQAGHPEAVACLGVHLTDIRLFQGRSGEMTELLRTAADDNPHIPCYRAVLALCLAEHGDLDAAAHEYRTFAGHSFSKIPDDSNRLLTLAVLADVATTIEDRAGAAELLGLLEPHAHRHAVLNCFAGGGAYWGPVATQLGRLATLIGDPRAQRWLREAHRAATSFGAPLAASRVPLGVP